MVFSFLFRLGSQSTNEKNFATEIVSDIQNYFCTQHFLPMFCKRRASDKDLPVNAYLVRANNVFTI